MNEQTKHLLPQEKVHVYLHMMGIAPYPEIVEAFTATCMYAATPKQVERVGKLIKPLSVKTAFDKMQEDLYALRLSGVEYKPINTGVPF